MLVKLDSYNLPMKPSTWAHDPTIGKVYKCLLSPLNYTFLILKENCSISWCPSKFIFLHAWFHWYIFPLSVNNHYVCSKVSTILNLFHSCNALPHFPLYFCLLNHSLIIIWAYSLTWFGRKFTKQVHKSHQEQYTFYSKHWFL